MRRAAVMALAACLVLVAGCPEKHGRGTASPTPSAGTTASPSAPSSSVLPRFVLIADLQEHPARWAPVAFIPFGSQRGRLGFMRFRESINSQPSSFAVAEDGSWWLDDRWKSRIAHFSATGRFLDDIEGIPERGVDIVVAGGRLAVLATQGGLRGGAVVATPNPDRTWSRTVINDGTRPLLVADLLPSADGLLGEIAGYAASRKDIGRGPIGIARLDVPGTGQAHLLPGLPVEGGASFSLRLVAERGGDQDFQLTYALAGQTVNQPLRINVMVGGKGIRSHEVPGEVGPGEYIAVGGDVLMYVKVAPSDAADAKRFGGGRWLLRVGRSPVLWERVPSPQIPDEPQHRHIAVGPDGAIYLMVAMPGGIEILRRD